MGSRLHACDCEAPPFNDLYVILLAKATFYFVLEAHCLNYRVIPCFSGGAYHAWLAVNHTRIFNLHGVIVFLSLLAPRLVTEQNRTAALYSVLIIPGGRGKD